MSSSPGSPVSTSTLHCGTSQNRALATARHSVPFTLPSPKPRDTVPCPISFPPPEGCKPPLQGRTGATPAPPRSGQGPALLFHTPPVLSQVDPSLLDHTRLPPTPPHRTWLLEGAACGTRLRPAPRLHEPRSRTRRLALALANQWRPLSWEAPRPQGLGAPAATDAPPWSSKPAPSNDTTASSLLSPLHWER